MTKTLASLAHREHIVLCATHHTVAKAPTEALAIWFAADHVGTFPECKGKVTFRPTARITPEGNPSTRGPEGNGSGEIK